MKPLIKQARKEEKKTHQDKLLIGGNLQLSLRQVV